MAIRSLFTLILLLPFAAFASTPTAVIDGVLNNTSDPIKFSVYLLAILAMSLLIARQGIEIKSLIVFTLLLSVGMILSRYMHNEMIGLALLLLTVLAALFMLLNVHFPNCSITSIVAIAAFALGVDSGLGATMSLGSLATILLSVVVSTALLFLGILLGRYLRHYRHGIILRILGALIMLGALALLALRLLADS